MYKHSFTDYDVYECIIYYYTLIKFYYNSLKGLRILLGFFWTILSRYAKIKESFE